MIETVSVEAELRTPMDVSEFVVPYVVASPVFKPPFVYVNDTGSNFFSSSFPTPVTSTELL
jgi:hypothetical protein